MAKVARLIGGKSTRQHAEELGESYYTVVEWVRRGMPGEEPQRSEWVAAHKATSKNRPKGDIIQLAPGSKAESVVVSKQEAELRYRELKNRLLEIELAKAEGRLISVEDIASVNSRLHGIVVNRLMGLGKQLADRLVNQEDPAEVQVIVEKAVRDCLVHISNGNGRTTL